MTYSEAIQFLYGLRLFGMKLGLENSRRLAELVGRPQDRLRFIHVAGTNGKGSTCAMLEGIYRAAGLRVGLFTSPHLVSFSERIQVNRRRIPQEDVVRLVEQLKDTAAFADAAGNCPTFFEAVTVMALIYFAEQKCDLVVWETGLGGRLDATNIVTPLASVITNVQYDHQEWLGNTLPEIAREKAGIIKEGIPVITGAEEAGALQVIVETAAKLHAPLLIVGLSDLSDHEISLPGEHQKKNAALAVKVARVLAGKIAVTGEALREGLKTAQWAGRFQIVRRGGQTLVLDGAHNAGGAETLARTWRSQFPGQQPALVMGMMRDKDCAAICKALAPLAAKIFLTPVGNPRTADPDLLAEDCRQANSSAQIVMCGNLAEALEKSASEPFVLLTGSLYLVGEALELLGDVAPGERSLNEYAPPSAIRAVTFDVGGTLIEPWPSVGHVYSAVAKRHGIDVPPESLDQQFALAWKTKNNFAHGKADWSDLVDKTFAGLTHAPLSRLLFEELYEEFAQPAAWRVFADVVPCLERLKRNGLKLAVVSNWDERLRPLLSALDLARYFDAIIVSQEAGHAKPAREIFQLAADKLALRPGEILHVGDSRKEDFEGARAAGFQAMVVRRGKTAEEQGTITSLVEVCHAQNKAG